MKAIGKIVVLLLVICMVQQNTFAQVSVGISIRIAPPALPIYTQPECPVDGYMWQPGYWAYDNIDGYYWVPGMWVAPPRPGLYWTPAYWAYVGGLYGFHSGYWGPRVGYYGGINYGCGYYGNGYSGGRWDNGRFRYNTAVVRVNRTVIHNTYIDRSVVRNNNNRISFNGPGGVTAKPRAQDRLAARERIQPTSSQISHQTAARKDRNSFAKVNNGRPATPAISRPSVDNNRTPASRPGAVNHQQARPQRNTAQGQVQQQREVQHQNPAQREQRAPQQARPVPQQQARPQVQPERQQQRVPQQQRPMQQPQRQQQRPAPQQQARPQAQPQRQQPQQRAPQQPRQQGGERREGGGERH
nr:YXWGXW repeat-containing protein [Pedobacter sp. ASV19]